jgi:secondary thiamine-phosphate synthase enzyme
MNDKFVLKTKGFNDVINITDQVSKIVKKFDVKEGICFISCPGSTSGITTIEYESGAVSDLKRIMDNLVPMSKDYEHCKKWGDCNGYAHIRSALINPFLAVSIENRELLLGTWQQVVFLDFDNRERRREIRREIRVKILVG